MHTVMIVADQVARVAELTASYLFPELLPEVGTV